MGFTVLRLKRITARLLDPLLDCTVLEKASMILTIDLFIYKCPGIIVDFRFSIRFLRSLFIYNGAMRVFKITRA